MPPKQTGGTSTHPVTVAIHAVRSRQTFYVAFTSHELTFLIQPVFQRQLSLSKKDATL